MKNIIFISTIHEEIGKCNVNELLSIMEEIKPDTIFLEALDKTYSNYQKKLFLDFNIFHKKLEIQAIQKYGLRNTFNYVPVLDNGLPNFFEEKYNRLSENYEFKKSLDNLNKKVSEIGFAFLNSSENIKIQNQMRLLESRILNDDELESSVNLEIDKYENSMIKNILSYSKGNNFKSAIFMCGSAHRYSMITKLKKNIERNKGQLNLIIYNG